jgi:membrane protease YdiL (CAAX protease family)
VGAGIVTEPRGIRGLVHRFPLISYFVVAVSISWIVVLVHVIPEPNLPTTWVSVVFITSGPFLSAFLMQWLISGRAGVHHLLRRMVRVRVSWIWYLVALLGIPLFLVAGTMLLPGALAGMNLAGPDWLAYLWQFPLVLAVGGPLLEEPGWRGFALPRLEAKFGYWGPLAGTLVLGVIWAAWHFPQYMMPEWAGQNGGFSIPSMLIYIAGVIPIAVILSWIYNVTRGSLFMVILAHTSINAFGGIVILSLMPVGTDTLLFGIIGFGVPALVILLVTRGRLGFDRYLREVPPEERALDGTADALVRLGAKP